MALISCPHLNLLDATPPQLVKAAAAAGFDSVGVRLVPTMQGETPHPMQIGSPMLRETQNLLNNTGVKVIDIEAVWIRPELDPASLKPAFESASALGARSIQVISADPEEDRAVERLVGLCAVGEPLGLRMELEFMAFAETNSLAKVRRMLNKAGQANAGVLLDTLHVARCSVPLDEIAALEPGAVNVLQLCDAPRAAPTTRENMIREARFERLLPGDGELDLVETCKRVRGIAAVSIEVPLPIERRGQDFERRAMRVMNGFRKFSAAFQHGESPWN
jgi:sugar phosphate isomerase/epimerase